MQSGTSIPQRSRVQFRRSVVVSELGHLTESIVVTDPVPVLSGRANHTITFAIVCG
jgi:hypothetical protein